MTREISSGRRGSRLALRSAQASLAALLLLVSAASAYAGVSSQIIGAGPPTNRQTATVQIRHLDDDKPVAKDGAPSVLVYRTGSPTAPLNNPAPAPTVGSASEEGSVIVFVLDNTLSLSLPGAAAKLGDAIASKMDPTRRDRVGIYIVDREGPDGAKKLAPTDNADAVRTFVAKNFNFNGKESPILTTTRRAVEDISNDLTIPGRREIILISDGLDETCKPEADIEGCLKKSIDAIRDAELRGAVPVAVSTLAVNDMAGGSNIDLRWLTGLEVLATQLHGVHTTIRPRTANDLADAARESMDQARSVYLYTVNCLREPALSDGVVSLEAIGSSKTEAAMISIAGLHCDSISAVCDRVPACAAAAPPPPPPSSAPTTPAPPVEPPASELSSKQWAGVALALVAVGLIVWLVLRSKKQKALEAKQAQLAADQRRRDAESAAAAAFAAAQPGFNAQANQPVRPLAGPTSMEGAGAAPVGGQPRSAADGLRAWRSDVDGPHLAILSGGKVFAVRIGASSVALGVAPDGTLSVVPDRDASSVLIVARDSGVGLVGRASRAGLNIRRDLDQVVIENQTALAPGTMLHLPGGALVESRLVDPSSSAPFAAQRRRAAWQLAPAEESLARLGNRRITSVPLLVGRQPDARHDCETFDLSLGGSEPAASRVSGNHARIWVSGGYLFVADCGSSNGSFINGNRLHPHHPTLVQAGDRVSFSSNIHFIAGDA